MAKVLHDFLSLARPSLPMSAPAIPVAGMGEKGLPVPTPDGVREPQNRRLEIVLTSATIAPRISIRQG
jgi:hypothetical protein